MTTIKLPNGWKPRDYQMPLWTYFERGGKRAVAVWHRRAGKDDVSLHVTCVKAHERVGTYWHMLPEASQARKAIWEAVDPHTGVRRIDQAFPKELREVTRENEMFIRFRNGSTWQVVGSDNYDSLVGSPPLGVVFSEYALANPRSWDYLRPILKENGGWAIFIYTPRGKNHGWKLFDLARREPSWFAEKLTVDDTKRLTKEDIEQERRDGMSEDMIQQEYYASFESSGGTVYGKEIAALDDKGRIGIVDYDPDLPCHTAWDLGFDDLTAIWFFQIARDEIRLIDYYENNGQGMPFYADVIKSKPYWEKGGDHYGPHDAAYKLQAAGGRSIVQQLWEEGIKMKVVKATSQQNGIEALRATLPHCWISTRCGRGIEALREYFFPWDDNLRTFKSVPRHDWSSHACDAAEIIGQVWREAKPAPEEIEPRFERTAEEIFWGDLSKADSFGDRL